MHYIRILVFVISESHKHELDEIRAWLEIKCNKIFEKSNYFYLDFVHISRFIFYFNYALHSRLKTKNTNFKKIIRGKIEF